VDEETLEEKKQRANNGFKINNIGKMFSNKLFGNKPASNVASRPGDLVSTSSSKKDQALLPKPKSINDNQSSAAKIDQNDLLLIDFEDTSISGTSSNNENSTTEKEEVLIDFSVESEGTQLSADSLKSNTSSSNLLDFLSTNPSPTKQQTNNEWLNKPKMTNSTSSASLRTFTPKLSQKQYANKQTRLTDINQLTKDSKTQFIFL